MSSRQPRNCEKQAREYKKYLFAIKLQVLEWKNPIRAAIRQQAEISDGRPAAPNAFLSRISAIYKQTWVTISTFDMENY